MLLASPTYVSVCTCACAPLSLPPPLSLSTSRVCALLGVLPGTGVTFTLTRCDDCFRVLCRPSWWGRRRAQCLRSTLPTMIIVRCRCVRLCLCVCVPASVTPVPLFPCSSPPPPLLCSPDVLHPSPSPPPLACLVPAIPPPLAQIFTVADATGGVTGLHLDVQRNRKIGVRFYIILACTQCVALRGHKKRRGRGTDRNKELDRQVDRRQLHAHASEQASKEANKQASKQNMCTPKPPTPPRLSLPLPLPCPLGWMSVCVCVCVCVQRPVESLLAVHGAAR